MIEIPSSAWELLIISHSLILWMTTISLTSGGCIGHSHSLLIDCPESVSRYHSGKNPRHSSMSMFTKETVPNAIIPSQPSAPSTFFNKTCNPEEVSYSGIFEVLVRQERGCDDGHITKLAVAVDSLAFFTISLDFLNDSAPQKPEILGWWQYVFSWKAVLMSGPTPKPFSVLSHCNSTIFILPHQPTNQTPSLMTCSIIELVCVALQCRWTAPRWPVMALIWGL